MTEILRHVGDILVIYSTVIALAFVMAYHFRSTWWKSQTGKSIMTLWAVISSVFVLSTIRLITGSDNVWFAGLRLAVFASVPVVLTWHFVLLVRAQRAARRERKRNSDRSDIPEGLERETS